MCKVVESSVSESRKTGAAEMCSLRSKAEVKSRDRKKSNDTGEKLQFTNSHCK
jgi:hypothetical protein